ncbi:MAG: hypothetical protein AABY22_33835, partial [Nanoarchaeota archaeon]
MPTIKGTKFTIEHRMNLSKSMIGKNKGKKRSLATRKQMSVSHTGMKFSKTHKENLTKAIIKRIKEKGHPWLGKKHKLNWKLKVAGGKNTQWKGSKVGYVALHSWVRRELGKPNKCDFCGRNDENQNIYEWANKSGNYLRDLNDWIRLCKKC